MKYCGIDEAGRGSVMGPMVVGILRTDEDRGLISLGVKDSKKLTPGKREEIYEELAGSYEIRVVEMSASEIDSLRETKTLNEIELDMFAEACNLLPGSCTYADCPDVNESRFQSLLERRVKGRVVAKHGADNHYPAVSGASIVAKVVRDRRIDELSGKLGENIGSGYPSDAVTMEFIEKWIKHNGSPPLDTRCSWEPVRRMLSVAANTKLDDW
jgi:ribonuclease HII